MLGRRNCDSDLLVYAVRFIYLGILKREVLIAAILQLTEVHTHICFATTLVVARHAAAVVSCFSNVQSFTELTALTLKKSNNNNWDYGFTLPQQLKSRKLISLARFFGHHSVLFVTGSVHTTPFSKCATRPATLCKMQRVTNTRPQIGWSVA